MIRTIHPLYLLASMILLLIILIWQNSVITDEIVYEKSQRESAETLAKHIVELKKVMRSPSKSELDSFIKGTQFRGAQITSKFRNGRYTVQAKSMNARQLQAFLNRILNMSAKIESFGVSRKSSKEIRLDMEISL